MQSDAAASLALIEDANRLCSLTSRHLLSSSARVAADTDYARIMQDLGLGVFDMRRSASDHSDSETSTDSESGDDSSDASGSATDGVDSEVEDAYGTLIGNFLTSTPSTQRPMRPLPKRAHPIIQMLEDPGPSDVPAHENENNPS